MFSQCVCALGEGGGVFDLQLVVKEKFWYDAALFPDLRREKDLHRKQTMLQHLLIEEMLYLRFKPQPT